VETSAFHANVNDALGWHQFCSGAPMHSLLERLAERKWGRLGRELGLVAALFVMVGLWSRSAEACSCGVSTAIASWGPGDTHDRGSPILVWDDDPSHHVLSAGDGGELSVVRSEVRDDDFCGGSLYAYQPEETPAVGSTLSVVDVARQSWVDQISEREWAKIYADPDYDPADYRYAYWMKVVEPRPTFETQLQVSVYWDGWWPRPFADSICAAAALIPYDSRGSARVQVGQAYGDLNAPPEFYLAARVTLPGGEVFQTLGKRWVGDVTQVWTDVPLTRPGDVPECVSVTVYDHLLRPVFEENICAGPDLLDSGADAGAWRKFTADLRALRPALPSEPESPEGSLGGCSFGAASRAAPQFGGGLWLIALALGFGARRTARARGFGRARLGECSRNIRTKAGPGTS